VGVCGWFDIREAGGCMRAVKAKLADLHHQVSMRCCAPMSSQKTYRSNFMSLQRSFLCCFVVVCGVRLRGVKNVLVVAAAEARFWLASDGRLS